MRNSINYSLSGRLASQTRRRQGATLATISTRPINPTIRRTYAQNGEVK